MEKVKFFFFVDFFKVKEKSGSFTKWAVKFEIQGKGKFRKFSNFGPNLFGCGKYFSKYEQLKALYFVLARFANSVSLLN